MNKLIHKYFPRHVAKDSDTLDSLDQVKGLTSVICKALRFKIETTEIDAALDTLRNQNGDFKASEWNMDEDNFAGWFKARFHTHLAEAHLKGGRAKEEEDTVVEVQLDLDESVRERGDSRVDDANRARGRGTT